jgi:hypothetical protein
MDMNWSCGKNSVAFAVPILTAFMNAMKTSALQLRQADH